MPDIKKLRGIDLGRAFSQELVEPILAEEFPELSYAAGIIGSGSEVLGFDDDFSSDHDWGPRTMLFLSVDELKNCNDRGQKTEGVTGRTGDEGEETLTW